MTINRVTVFGGSGFIGRYIVQRLARQGVIVRVAVRRPDSALFLKPMGDVGQIAPFETDLNDPAAVARAVEGADAVINAVSLYVERGRKTFASIHETGAQTVAKAAAEAGVERLVHISGIGAHANSASKYARARARGDALVREAFPAATILAPSVVFGPEDRLFNVFGLMARLSPVLPLFGLKRIDAFPFVDGGATKMQPVYVGDVADAAVAVLDRDEALGTTFELGGPAVMSFREMIELTCRITERNRLLVPIPFWWARIWAWFLKVLPNPPITGDQIRLLEEDNVVGPDAKGLGDLGIAATAAEAILPAYLGRFRRHGRHAEPRPA
ncbi:MAG: complex I NDUFA9 subunit family protein [Alphaproteobacteria bacterium]|nr:complex I NDUFA9 subunit family protein [Alphaproteobacteria bacterium]